MVRISAGRAAIFAGIAIAAPGIWLSRKFGDPYFDLGALAMIGLILMGAVFVLFKANGGLLSRKRINWNQIAHLREIISADPAVKSVGYLATTPLRTDSILLKAAVRFKHRLNPHELEQAIERLERSIKEQYPAIQRLSLTSPWLSLWHSDAGKSPIAAGNHPIGS